MKFTDEERKKLARICVESKKLGDTINNVNLLIKWVLEQISDWNERIVVVFLNMVIWHYAQNKGVDAEEIAEDVLHSMKKMKEQLK